MRPPGVNKAAMEKSILCWRCGKTGHTRYQCDREPKLFCSRCLQPGVLSRECVCPPRTQTRNRETAYQDTTANQPIRLPVRIQGHHFTATVDTGSNHSYIGDIVFNRCTHNSTREKLEPAGEVIMANGGVTAVKYAYTFDIIIEERIRRMRFGFLPDLMDEVILGMDFLRKNQGVIDVARRTVHFHEPGKPVIAEGRLQRSRRCPALSFPTTSHPDDD